VGAGELGGGVDERAASLHGTEVVASECGGELVQGAARVHAREIRTWVTGRIEELLLRLGHRDPRATAEQLMMVRTGAVVSGALDANPHLNDDFLACWSSLIDAGLPAAPSS